MGVESEKGKAKQPKRLKKQYFVCDGRCVYFRAGIKRGGDEVDPRWPEFRKNARLDEMIELGLIQVVEI